MFGQTILDNFGLCLDRQLYVNIGLDRVTCLDRQNSFG